MKNIMNLVNLTPHVIDIHHSSGVLTLQPSGAIARLAVSRSPRPPVTVDGAELSVFAPTLGEISGLPDPRDGTVYVVSALVADAAKRGDVMSPGGLVRDAGGNPCGCMGLCSYA